MAFEPIRSIRGGRGTLFASIDKQGRLIVPHAVATLVPNIKPGVWFELFVDRDTNQLLLKPTPYEKAYTVKATSTGKLSAWERKDQSGRTPNLVVSVRTALSHVNISIVSRMRVKIEWSDDLNGFVVHLPRPETVYGELAQVKHE